MNISKEGIALIKKFEGCELEAYKCPAGVWTIGYGHIKGVQEGDVITLEEAEDMLVEELHEYENYINDMVTVGLTPFQFDALVAWTFNLGVGNLRQSTMLRKLNEGDYQSVPSEMNRWNKAGGKTLDGLIRRRKAEGLLFESKEWHTI